MDKITDVFRTTGQPTITYVERDAGNLERRLEGYLDERGQLCLITGPSKTGKTTLYKQVLAKRGWEPIVVQCTAERTCEQIWKIALEQVNFDRIREVSVSRSNDLSVNAEISTKFGWKWLAEVSGKMSAALRNGVTENEMREKILSDPFPDLLIPVLQKTNFILIIEDFHYLDDKEKVLLFQQWKRFVDSEITIVVLGTSHRAVDIAKSNRDLIGRIAQIDVGRWDVSDLKKICVKGFDYLSNKKNDAVFNRICVEAVGLPIVVQQVCLQLFHYNNIFSVDDARKTTLKVAEERNSNRSMTIVANEKYSQFSTYYNTLIRCPREKSRKYRTYELVIACFTVDPITFSLTRQEIDSRIQKLEISQSEKPPAASLNSTLGALKKFQSKREFQLLEWMPGEDTLYIVEPSFLFYVRWRKNKGDSKNYQLDLFERLLDNIQFSNSGKTIDYTLNTRRDNAL